ALLGPLAADPSLRGVLEVIALGLGGIRKGETTPTDLARPIALLAQTFERVLAGDPPGRAELSWRKLLSDKAEGELADIRARRRIVLAHPTLDYGAIRSAGGAIDLVRQTARELGLTPENGVAVRLTGPAPLADEEFASVADGALADALLTLAAVTGLLVLALRSAKVILAVLVTLLVGLAVTAGLGLALVGELNLISIAFTVLFVGLGVDFGIQVSIRVRAELHAADAGEPLVGPLRRGVLGVGASLLLAAISTAVGFFSFLPTSFRGVSELGLIAGLGMLIAFVASVTLLPALLVVLRPRPSAAGAGGFGALVAVDRWIERHRRLVLAGTGVLVAASLPAMAWLRFDSDPLNLRDRGVESVRTYLDLARDPETSPNTIDVLTPSAEAAETLAKRLEALPEVSRVLTVSSFVPPDQDAKLELIQDAAFLLDATLNPPTVAPPPDDAQNRAALGALRREIAATRDPLGAAAEPATRLDRALGGLEAATPDRRAAAQAAVTGGLARLLAQLRAGMGAEPVTRDDLPGEIVSDWIAADGRARVEVFPKIDRSGTSASDAALASFANAVREIAPRATGAPVTGREAERTVVTSFVQAGAVALLAITVLLSVALRSVLDVVLTLIPLVLSGLFTLALCAVLDLPLNFANIIALPLMFGVGVAFHIYYVIAWRAGERDMLASSLTRAILFSALTTGAAFGSLWLSHHPGTASMGRLLTISLAFTLAAAFVIVPAFLGPPPRADPPSSR
ncbi:MAG: MMPL family transporter, partial [Methylobacteriaceae bacterium]|nr:MMPL family transporter [Methylobacteriaceae bacterium]